MPIFLYGYLTCHRPTIFLLFLPNQLIHLPVFQWYFQTSSMQLFVFNQVIFIFLSSQGHSQNNHNLSLPELFLPDLFSCSLWVCSTTRTASIPVISFWNYSPWVWDHTKIREKILRDLATLLLALFTEPSVLWDSPWDFRLMLILIWAKGWWRGSDEQPSHLIFSEPLLPAKNSLRWPYCLHQLLC